MKGGQQYSGVQVQYKYKNLVKKYKEILDAKNKNKVTKPWKFYEAFHDAARDKPEISFKYVRENGLAKVLA